MPRTPAPRFHVEVELAGRMVRTLACGPDLVIGEGGDVVVPGLGGAFALLRDGRLLPIAGLAGALTGGDAPRDVAALDPAGVAFMGGMRALVSPLAHPQITIAIEPLATAAIERGGVGTFVPARETVLAAAIAGVLALWVGREIVRHELTEPERERPERREDETPIERAMYTAPTVVPEFVAAPVFRFAELEPPPPAPEVRDDEVRVAAATPEIASPVALLEVGAAPERVRKRGARRHRAGADGAEMVAILGALEGDDAAIVDMIASREFPAAAQGNVARGSIVEMERPDDGGAVTGSRTAELGGGGTADLVIPEAVAESDLPDEAPRRELPEKTIVEDAIVVGVEGDELGGVAGGVVGGVAGGVPDAVEAPPAPKLDPDAPPPPDPHRGPFELADALAGDPSLAPDRPGKLVAVIRTSRGTMRCALFDDRAPRTVANFIGLARGVRPWLDTETNRWTRRPLYDGTTFHRIVDGFVIQGGDPKGVGSGGPGYTFADEIDPALGFDRAGVLAMANRGRDTNGSQFFIAVAPAPHIAGSSTIFGHCEPELAQQLAKVAVDEKDRPKREVRIEAIRIVRE